MKTKYLNINGDLIGSKFEMKLRAEHRKIMKHHNLPNDGVVEADVVRAFLAALAEETD